MGSNESAAVVVKSDALCIACRTMQGVSHSFKGQLAPRKLTFDNVTIINMGQEITIDQKTNLLWPTVRALE